MHKLWIVEDDPVIAGAMEKHLSHWGYEIRIAEDFGHLMGEFAAFQPHLILMDLSLPHFNGFHWCMEIRKCSTVPMIVISSAADNMNIVMTINMGADDFISKPFDLQVLTAKVQGLLRRSYAFRDETAILAHQGVVLDLHTAQLLYQGERIPLTKNEYQILSILMEHVGTVVRREEIMIRLWQDEHFIDDNTLTVNVARLRKKLAGFGLAGFVATKKGMGYQIPPVLP